MPANCPRIKANNYLFRFTFKSPWETVKMKDYE